MTTTIDTYESEEDWLEHRSSGIGASESPILFGVGYAGTSTLSLYADKTTKQRTQFDEATLKRMRMGQILEPAIVELFEEQTGLTVYKHPWRVYRQSETPWMFATPDAIAHNLNDEQECVEVKFVGRFQWAEWDEKRAATEDACPLKYQIQAQHQLYCTGLQVCWLVGFLGDEIVIRKIQRNDEFIETLKLKCRHFWANVTHRVIPEEVTAHDAEPLRRIFGDGNGETITLNAKAEELVASIEDMQKVAKTLGENIEQAKNELRMLIGENTHAVTPQGRRITWKKQERKGYIVKSNTSRVLKILD